MEREDIREDKNFLYLELEVSEDTWESFAKLGQHPTAKSTYKVNNGERYVPSVEK